MLHESMAGESSRFTGLSSKITYEQLLAHLLQRLSRPVTGNEHDFLPLLEECSTYFEVSGDFLLQRGFRKAYRQILEGI